MLLIRLLVLKMLTENVRVFAKYVKSKKNYYSDALSRLQIQHFCSLANANGKTFNKCPEELLPELWPMNKLWLY